LAYELVILADEQQVAIHPEDIQDWAEEHGVEITGTMENPRVRAELHGHPKLAGFVGPAWGGETVTGEPVIRYEDTAVYAALSA